MLPGMEALQRLVPWLSALLILMLAHSLADLTWRLVPDGDVEPLPGLRSAPGAPLAAPASRANLERVAALHLLGRVELVQEASPTPVVAPETRLNLSLKGVLAYSIPGEALALIGQGSAEELVYRIGDSLPGGATLHEIHPDRVILSRSGRFETLTLPKERTDTTPAPVGTPASSTPATATPGGVAQQLRELRDTLIQSPQDAMRLINIQPVVSDGQITGYSVRPGQDRRLFNSVGLRPGDVITAVNGIPLNDPAQLGALYQQLSSASTLNITLERRGSTTELNLNLE